MLLRRAIRLLLLTALVAPLVPAGALAGGITAANYFCFDEVGDTGIGQSFTGTCTAESPFAQPVRDGSFQYFHFEDWESFSLNNFVEPIPVTVPGVVVSAGGGGGITNSFSADADDGAVDGVSTAPVQTAFSNGVGAEVATITFDETDLGAFPTHAAILVTGVGNFGAQDVTVEFFGPGAVSLGSITRQFDISSNNDSTDDQFMGWTDLGGIESFRIGRGPQAGVNFDHLQYGYVPEPATATLLALGIAALGATKRRGRSRARP